MQYGVYSLSVMYTPWDLQLSFNEPVSVAGKAILSIKNTAKLLRGRGFALDPTGALTALFQTP